MPFVAAHDLKAEAIIGALLFSRAVLCGIMFFRVLRAARDICLEITNLRLYLSKPSYERI